ncbi:MAG: c-type cytochrome [Rhodospirillales bacterium]
MAECQGCHGLPGLHRNPALPLLYGQDRKYLEHQMTAFQRDFVGTHDGFLRLDRKHPVMSGEAPKMDRREIPVIAAWFARQSCISSSEIDGPSVTPESLPEHAARCMTCHGREGHSTTTFIPTLAGQRKAYLIAALHAFRDSLRPDRASAGRSRSHNMMTRQGRYLSDAEIENLAAYFAARNCR